MIDSFKEYFIDITFEKIPRINNMIVNVMASIGSLLDILHKSHKCEFLVE